MRIRGAIGRSVYRRRTMNQIGFPAAAHIHHSHQAMDLVSIPRVEYQVIAAAAAASSIKVSDRSGGVANNERGIGRRSIWIFDRIPRPLIHGPMLASVGQCSLGRGRSCRARIEKIWGMSFDKRSVAFCVVCIPHACSIGYPPDRIRSNIGLPIIRKHADHGVRLCPSDRDVIVNQDCATSQSNLRAVGRTEAKCVVVNFGNAVSTPDSALGSMSCDACIDVVIVAINEARAASGVGGASEIVHRVVLNKEKSVGAIPRIISK